MVTVERQRLQAFLRVVAQFISARCRDAADAHRTPPAPEGWISSRRDLDRRDRRHALGSQPCTPSREEVRIHGHSRLRPFHDLRPHCPRCRIARFRQPQAVRAHPITPLLSTHNSPFTTGAVHWARRTLCGSTLLARKAGSHVASAAVTRTKLAAAAQTRRS